MVFICVNIFTSQSTNFLSCWDGSSYVEPVLRGEKSVLLKDTTKRLEPAILLSRVKHSATEPPQHIVFLRPGTYHVELTYLMTNIQL